jgi:hypothetical protein
MLGVELLDSVTLQRVSRGVIVTAKGLTGVPILNESGIFVWRSEDITKLEKLVIDPQTVPFEPVEILPAQVVRPLHRVELRPRASYPFPIGITAIRGSLYETRVPLGTQPTPVVSAAIRLQWLDDDGTTWRPWQAPTTTNAMGEFVAILRLARGRAPQPDQPSRADQHPRFDAQGRMTVRLFAKKAAGPEKQITFQLPQGRVVDETYAWDELQ